MNAPLPPDDTQLGAWLDGELPPAEHDRISAWLEAHPADAQRVQAWAADRDALRALWGPVVQEPVPPALQRQAWRGASRAAWARAAMVAGLLVTGARWCRPAGHRLRGGAGLQRGQLRRRLVLQVEVPQVALQVAAV
ncbi:MAG: hypothetical protein IIZ92_13800, partial [Aquincola sp.]|nr:hypothetical protein [Aquincola sp.]